MKTHHRYGPCNGSPDCYGCLADRVDRDMRALDDDAHRRAKASIDESLRVNTGDVVAIVFVAALSALILALVTIALLP